MEDEMQTVNDNSEINDLRNPSDFKGITLSGFKKTEVRNQLIDSIKKFEQSKNTAICILDAGLTEEQKTALSRKVDEIKNAEWDIEVPGFKVRGKEWLKSQVSRAFIPKYFPKIRFFFCHFLILKTNFYMLIFFIDIVLYRCKTFYV